MAFLERSCYCWHAEAILALDVPPTCNSIHAGILTCLMGVSGAGKTTLMDVLAGRKTGAKILPAPLLVAMCWPSSDSEISWRKSEDSSTEICCGIVITIQRLPLFL